MAGFVSVRRKLRQRLVEGRATVLVTVIFGGLMRSSAGCAELPVELEAGGCLADLLAMLKLRFEGEVREILERVSSAEAVGDEGFPVFIAVDSQDYRFAQGLDTPLQDGQKVYIVVPAPGG
ncbi:MAG: hypothetical protein D9V47_14735 [Clostridia bacterium]|nr:MAG: hypothetical protein D9V47_14735 [Clostridia bacterium]